MTMLIFVLSPPANLFSFLLLFIYLLSSPHLLSILSFLDCIQDAMKAAGLVNILFLDPPHVHKPVFFPIASLGPPELFYVTKQIDRRYTSWEVCPRLFSCPSPLFFFLG